MRIRGLAGELAGRGWRLWQRSRWQYRRGAGEPEEDGLRQASPDDLEPLLLAPSDLDLLARLVKAEAEGEPYTGQVAVAAVVLNRLRSPAFANDVRSVIYQRGQFETVSNGRINEPADAVHFRAVEEALSGRDPSNGALFFFNPAGTRDRFVHSLSVTTRIGRHTFA